MDESYDQNKQNREKGKLVVEVSGNDIIVEIAGNNSDVGLGQVNEACTDDIINLEHDDSQTKDVDTQP